ncbi:MAG: hypothetical protein U0936_20240 [Planctomycetaceae bacterium]
MFQWPAPVRVACYVTAYLTIMVIGRWDATAFIYFQFLISNPVGGATGVLYARRRSPMGAARYTTWNMEISHASFYLPTAIVTVLIILAGEAWFWANTGFAVRVRFLNRRRMLRRSWPNTICLRTLAGRFCC